MNEKNSILRQSDVQGAMGVGGQTRLVEGAGLGQNRFSKQAIFKSSPAIFFLTSHGGFQRVKGFQRFDF